MTLELAPNELIIINNALNEVCNGIDLDHIRMGCSLEAARALLAKIHAWLARA